MNPASLPWGEWHRPDPDTAEMLALIAEAVDAGELPQAAVEGGELPRRLRGLW